MNWNHQCVWIFFVTLCSKLTTSSTLVSMRGEEFIKYEITKETAIHAKKLHMVFQFKTINPSSLLLFSRNSYAGDYICVELLDGKLWYKVRLGSDETEEQQISIGEGLNDYQWHVVDITLNNGNVTIELDYKKHFYTFKGDYVILDLNEQVYFGGIDNRVDVSSYRITKRRYSGCLRGLMFNNIDILYNTKFSRPNHASAGNLQWEKCEDIDFQPIMFTNPQDHALLPTYLPNSLSINFKFRTHIGKGLMFSKMSKMVGVTLSLKDAVLHLDVRIGKGNGVINRFQGKNLDDGFWHRVEIHVDKNIIKFKLDDNPVQKHYSPYSKLVSFHQNNATLGGGEEHIMQGFVGCMYDIWVDDTFIDYKKLHPAYSIGVIKKCNLKNRCLLSPCQNGGKCIQDHKSFKCDCFNTMYSGDRCEKSVYQPSCQEYKDLGLNEDSYCTIDPDGDDTQVKPLRVLCNMTRFPDKAVTIYQHDLKGEIPVAKGDIEGGSYHHNLNYKIDLETFDVLLKNAVQCRQHVNFKCKNAFLMRSPRGPPDTVWVGRAGNNEEYWGGAEPDSGKCACGNDKSCAKKYTYCNCDAGDDKWRSDEGFLTQIERLPVMMLSFKLSGNQSFFSVGNLECQYNSTASLHNLSKIRVLKACRSLNYIPTTRPVVTDLPLNQEENPMNYRQRNNPFAKNPTKHVVLPVVPNVNVNVTLEIPKGSNQPERPQDGLKFTLSVYAVIVIAVATVIVVIIIAIVVIAKRCQGHSRSSRRHNDSLDMEDERGEHSNEMCTFFGSFSRADNNRPVIEVHRHSIHCDTLDELPPAYREFAHTDYVNQPITTHIDLSYKPRKKNFGVFC